MTYGEEASSRNESAGACRLRELPGLPDVLEELLYDDVGIPQRPSKCVAIDLIVVGEDDRAPIAVHHLDMAPPAVRLTKSQPLQCSHNLPLGEQG